MRTVALALAAALLAACSPAEATRTVTVFAAASLTETFEQLAKKFEAQHDGVDVRLSFGGSSRLAEQIVEGAPAEVFAAADEKAMAKVTAARLADGKPRVFARNRLTIAVPPGNPMGLKGLADLRKDDLTVVMCAAEVPCGRAARALTTAAQVQLEPASEEPDVKSVLGKVATGEADAGLVYVTDVRAADDKVDGVPIAGADAAANSYPIVMLREAAENKLARQFVQFVLSDEGQRVLRDAGFDAP
ncbi:molybdate ABC transporter substrate-binding protein [Thermocrispum municipale]|uniref:molybdate ABC transporter substrate-binding protein n=1 Tax=Thermocrispum municipale TaxID=37926 RepID=UPI00041A74A9|nr:molybdate ABC transporter substrate-binding protein [Thermocrispum municipale]